MNTPIFKNVALAAAAALLVTVVAVAPGSAAQGPPEFSLPPQAAEVAPGVFFLGTSVEAGRTVVGYAYAHHRDGHGGGPGGGGDGDDPVSGDASDCYSFIANGARWQSQEKVRVNADAGPASAADIEGWMRAWEDQPIGSAAVYGTFEPTSVTLEADATGTDGDNEVYFGSIADENVLGYTIVWSSRIGPPRSRPIIEADIVIDNDSEWDWWVQDGSTDIDPPAGELDLGAVFTHEAGHYVGLGHTDTTPTCADETMYPSLGSEGTKRSLGDGDKAGRNALY